MTPIAFKGHNAVFARDQPQYLPLPGYKTADGRVVTCWRLSWKERLKVLYTGCVWANQLTFNQPLQPQRLDIDRPFEEQPA